MSQISITLDVTVSLNTGVNKTTLDPFVFLSITAQKGFLDLSWTVEKSSRHALMNLLGTKQSIVLPLQCSLEAFLGDDGELHDIVVCEYVMDDVSLVFTPRDRSTRRTIKAMLDKYREELYSRVVAASSSVSAASPVSPTSPASDSDTPTGRRGK